MVTMEDLAMGSMMRVMICSSLALSRRADSTSSSGICLNAWRSMKMPKELVAKGRICGQRELIMRALAIIR